VPRDRSRSQDVVHSERRPALAVYVRISFSPRRWLVKLTSVTRVDDEYFPDDPSTVDLIGVDWYPKQESGFGESCLGLTTIDRAQPRLTHTPLSQILSMVAPT
jgi:hypothetical protein